MKELRAQLAHVDPSRMAPAPQLRYFFLGFRSWVLKSGSLKYRMMVANLGIQSCSNKLEGDPLFPGKKNRDESSGVASVPELNKQLSCHVDLGLLAPLREIRDTVANCDNRVFRNIYQYKIILRRKNWH